MLPAMVNYVRLVRLLEDSTSNHIATFTSFHVFNDTF